MDRSEYKSNLCVRFGKYWDSSIPRFKKVEKITISASVERVGAGAFDNDPILQYVDFGDAITSIGAFAIQDSKSLIQIIVPDTLNNIYTIK